MRRAVGREACVVNAAAHPPRGRRRRGSHSWARATHGRLRLCTPRAPPAACAPCPATGESGRSLPANALSTSEPAKRGRTPDCARAARTCAQGKGLVLDDKGVAVVPQILREEVWRSWQGGAKERVCLATIRSTGPAQETHPERARSRHRLQHRNVSSLPAEIFPAGGNPTGSLSIGGTEPDPCTSSLRRVPERPRASELRSGRVWGGSSPKDAGPKFAQPDLGPRTGAQGSDVGHVLSFGLARSRRRRADRVKPKKRNVVQILALSALLGLRSG